MCEQPSTPQDSKAQTPSTLSSTPWREAPKISAPNLGVGNYADNIVLLPEFVDSSLILKSVQYVKVEAADENSSLYTFLTIGIANSFSGDTIEWLDGLGAEDDRRCSIALENGQWVGRDGRGRVSLVR
jgi:hypothetical protein